ncbi:MAG TPA: glycosyltransferase family 4 protein [Planctomycetota bacterium]
MTSERLDMHNVDRKTYQEVRACPAGEFPAHLGVFHREMPALEPGVKVPLGAAHAERESLGDARFARERRDVEHPRGVATPRVLLVAENASARFGGEAILPLHWFRVLRQRGIDARLVVHERTRDELRALMPDEADRMHFVSDTWLHRALWRVSTWLPQHLGAPTLGLLLRLLTQRRARAIARSLVRAHAVDVVHQVIPVSPKDPSLLAGLGVPLVIGPMNGGMQFPPAFRRAGRVQLGAVALLRLASRFVHRVLRGKLTATTLLVANARTAAALPSGCRGRVVEMVENGVDFALFDGNHRAAAPTAPAAPDAQGTLRLVFVGRLVDWKALDVALDAIADAGADVPCTLDVAGEGPMRAAWERHAAARGLGDRVRFHGFVPQTAVPAMLARADALLLPSIYECGGAVVLEAMAMGRVVVATAWGGPLDYLDEHTGILVPPAGRADLVNGFAAALRRLQREPAARAALGEAARRRCREHFDWAAKVDTGLQLYADAIARAKRGARRAANTMLGTPWARASASDSR